MPGDELAGWERVGGRRLQFYATDSEIAEWLRETLPPELGPFSVIGQEWDQRRWQPFEYPLEAIDDCFARHRHANLWLRSDLLSPGLTAEDEPRLGFNVRLFERLRQSMRDRLVVATAVTLADGTIAEDSPMTARAADAHRGGEVTFTARPVGLR